MTTIKKISILILLGFFCGFSFSQNYVKQVIIVNGGVWEFSPPYSDHVTIASYNPQNGETTVFDTIYTESVQDVIIYQHYAIVTAQDSIIKYDIDNYTRVGAIAVSGLNMLSVWNNKLIVGRGNGIGSDYVQIYNLSDLSLTSSISAVSDETYGIVVENDTAYIAVPGGWASTTGKIAVIDLSTNTLVREMELDTLGQGMRELISDGENIYSFNTMAYGSSYGIISNYNIATNVFEHDIINLPFGNGYNLCGISKNENLMYLVMNGKIAEYDLVGKTVINSSFIAPTSTIAETVFDTINELFYVTTTDYYSSGNGFIYNALGDSIGNFSVGISAQAMAIDYRNLTSIENTFETTSNVYPNPCTNDIYVNSSKKINSIEIYDIYGKKVVKTIYQENNKLNLSTLNSGSYFMKLKYNDSEIEYRNFIKL